MSECDAGEILKQIKILDNLKQLRDNMGDSFSTTFPELTGLSPKLDDLITEQEILLDNKLSECGNIELDEIEELPGATELIEGD
jgi:hypothetical protein